MEEEMNASMQSSFLDLRRCLQVFGFWPPSMTQENRCLAILCRIVALLNILVFGFVVATELAFMISKWPDIYLVARTGATVLTGWLVFLRLIIMYVKRHTLTHTISTVVQNDFSFHFPLARQSINLHSRPGSRGGSAESLMKLQIFLRDSLQRKLKECRIIFVVNLLFLLMTLLGYCVSPLVKILYYGTFHSENNIYIPYGAKVPFEQTTTPGFQISYAAQVWGSLVTIPGLIGFDSLFGSHMILTARQFELIIHVLENLEEYASTCVAPLSEQQNIINIKNKGNVDRKPISQHEAACHNILIQCVVHLEKLMKLFESINKAYELTLLFQVVSCSVVLCFVFFNYITDSSLGNRIASLGFIFVIVSQLFLYCWYGQSVINKSTAISDCVYNTRWFQMPVSYRRSALMLLRQSQRGVAVTVMGFSDLSLPLFTSIISTALSYFALLNSFLEDQQ